MMKIEKREFQSIRSSYSVFYLVPLESKENIVQAFECSLHKKMNSLATSQPEFFFPSKNNNIKRLNSTHEYIFSRMFLKSSGSLITTYCLFDWECIPLLLMLMVWTWEAHRQPFNFSALVKHVLHFFEFFLNHCLIEESCIWLIWLVSLKMLADQNLVEKCWITHSFVKPCIFQFSWCILISGSIQILWRRAADTA